MKRWGYVVIGLIAALIGGALAFPLPFIGSLGSLIYSRIETTLFPFDPVKPVYNDVGYYRVVAETSVAGEVLKLDVVIRCVTQKLPGRFRHLRIPYLYGLRTKTNHTVIMHTPDLCFSIEQDGQPPKALARFADDYLPLMFWGENADDLEEFTAYTAEIAYTHPKARMTRPKVRAMAATAQEYAAWQKTSAPKNILLSVPRDPFGSDFDLPPVADAPSVQCYGMASLPLTTQNIVLLNSMKLPTDRYLIIGYDPINPLTSSKLGDELRAQTGHWIPLAIMTLDEFNSAGGLPTHRTSKSDSGYGYPIGSIIPTPLQKSRSLSNFRRRSAFIQVDSISFSFRSDAHWGTASCQSMFPVAATYQTPVLSKQIVIDDLVIARRHKDSELAFIFDGELVWKIVRITATTTRGRLR